MNCGKDLGMLPNCRFIPVLSTVVQPQWRPGSNDATFSPDIWAKKSAEPMKHFADWRLEGK
jgi:hypothetical protein|tara:strand:+ start:218 stop:400 length:183 start_codon:yes stop_codon:yes gene_type:complete